MYKTNDHCLSLCEIVCVTSTDSKEVYIQGNVTACQMEQVMNTYNQLHNICDV